MGAYANIGLITAPNTGTFSFASRRHAVPSLPTIKAWLITRMGKEKTAFGRAIRSTKRAKSIHLPLWNKVILLVPSTAKRYYKRVEADCLKAAMGEMEKVYILMELFSVDLTTHENLRLEFEAIASYAVLSLSEQDHRQYVDRNRHRQDENIVKLEQKLDEIDTEMKIASLKAGLRATLEREAVGNILVEQANNPCNKRYLARLKLALGEVRQVHLHADLKRLIHYVERHDG